MDKTKVVRSGLLYVGWVGLMYLAVLGAQGGHTGVMLFGAISGGCVAMFVLLTARTEPIALNQTCLRHAPEAISKHDR